ncbi:ABC transporter permease [bacterium D16-51]|nr:ABC transporter permease [bacterium D16-59]RKI61131.1 ABC transporter permease [bacterium D16-51]
MNRSFVGMVVLSVCRRKRSVWKVALISFLCVFLFGGIMIFQDVMNRFQRENALKESGNWFVASEEKSELIREHAYFEKEGVMAVRTTAKEAGNLGFADQSFFEQSNIKLYEGRLPEAENEVAVTRQALSSLGASLEVGQKLTLDYDTQKVSKDGEPVYASKEVVVSGVLASYTRNWVNDIVFPEVFFTEKGLESLNVKWEAERHYFYSLKSEQINVDGGQFFEKLVDMISKHGEYNVLTYNWASYDVTMWGTQDMYYMAMVLCALLGSMSLVYLFSGCLHDRRSIYFRYLELGLTKGQLREMVGLEWAAVFLPTACAALVSSVLLTGVGAKILSAKYKIPNIFYLSSRSLLWIILFTFGVFLLVFLWCCLGFRIKGLHEMTGQIPIKRIRHLRRRGDGCFGGLVLFQKRRGRMYPGKTVVRSLFTVVALSIILYMGMLWRDRYRDNQNAAAMADIIGAVNWSGNGAGGMMVIDEKGRLAYNGKILEDETVSEEVKEEKRCEVRIAEPIASEDYVPVVLSDGLTEKQREKIERIQGVRMVAGETVAADMKLDWKNSRDSGFRHNHYIQDFLASSFSTLAENQSQLAEGEYNKAFAWIPDDLSCYEYSVYGLEKDSEVDRELHSCLKGFDSKAFWAGKQGILFALPDDSSLEEEGSKELEGVLSYDEEKKLYRFQGKEGQKYQYSFKENTLHTGDKIQILDSGEKELLSARVVVSGNRDCYRRILESVSKIYDGDGYYNLYSNVGYRGGYYFICSRNMMEKLAAKQGKNLSFHNLSVWFEEGEDLYQAEKQVAELFSEYGCEYQSTGEYKSSVKEDLERQRIISAVVIILTACCYFFIMQTMERKEMEQMEGQLRLLLCQGAWKQNILKVRAFFHGRGYLWGILSIPLCCLWDGIGEWNRLLQAYEDTEAEMDAAVFLKQFIAGWQDRIQDIWLWGIFVLFIIIAVLFLLAAEWQYLKKLKLQGGC